ncbi:MAG TPA: ribbon-helix-helix protein, CopG family [Mycobacteriales bacterium]|nr:ribbon-helix-helix protein, CopG family [Mycobacteriales bacterium]
MKVAVSVPDDLYARADRAAEMLGRSRSALYAEALRAYLDALGDGDDVTAALDALYTDDVHGGRVGAALGRRLLESGSWEW